MTNKKGILVVVSGPSGVGKDTIVESYLKSNPPSPCVLSVSATTRSPRQGETEGLNYYYKSEEEFENYIEKGMLLEYAQYSGNYYGTLKSEVDRHREQGEHVILIIEVVGAQNVKNLYPEALSVFIMPPSIDTLEERLSKRKTESEEVRKQRLSIAREEIARSRSYNYVIINDDLQESVDRLRSIIYAAECSPVHYKDLLEGVCDI